MLLEGTFQKCNLIVPNGVMVRYCNHLRKVSEPSLTCSGEGAGGGNSNGCKPCWLYHICLAEEICLTTRGNTGETIIGLVLLEASFWLSAEKGNIFLPEMTPAGSLYVHALLFIEQ